MGEAEDDGLDGFAELFSGGRFSCLVVAVTQSRCQGLAELLGNEVVATKNLLGRGGRKLWVQPVSLICTRTQEAEVVLDDHLHVVIVVHLVAVEMLIVSNKSAIPFPIKHLDLSMAANPSPTVSLLIPNGSRT